MNLISKAIAPLDAEALRWVETTRDAMTVEAQVAQLFVLGSQSELPEDVDALTRLRPGGLHRFPNGPLADVWRATKQMLESAEVPIVLSGDIEGGTVSYPFATPVPNQLAIAAIDDLKLSEELARLMARESRALGYDWSFTPVVDVNLDFRSAITGTRTYGSDPAKILAQALTQVRVFQEEGLAACAKHWPGDGLDPRDQHLLTSVNPLSMEDWWALFGHIYRTLIDAGLMTIMSAHIALPAYVRQHCPDVGRDAFAPATVSRLLNEELLRGELGFDGLIISDATGMAGLGSWMDHESAVPAVIENGCDAFLFSRDPQRDMDLMLRGLRNGKLSERRLHEAVTRMLRFKAELGLHRKSIDDRLPPLEQVEAILRSKESLHKARSAAGRSITLVKDVQNLLPLDPVRHRRIVVIAEEGWSFFVGALPRSFEPTLAALRAAGFDVRIYEPGVHPTRDDTDLVLYLIGQEATPVAYHIYLDFAKLHGGSRRAMTQYWHEIPTLVVSFGQPYYLYDAPACQTMINAYNGLEDSQIELVDRLLGHLPFTGVSPVDAFCGMEQLQW